jgi:hypothetical protein
MGNSIRIITEQEKRATASLLQLVLENPGCSIDTEYPQWLFGTNHITFGTLHGYPVVFKYFDWIPRKKQEEWALSVFAPTRLVPKLYPIQSESIIVMERLRGSTLYVAEPNLQKDQLEAIYRQLGNAIANMVTMAPGATPGGNCGMLSVPGFDYEFFCQASTGTLFDTVIKRSMRILTDHEVPDKVILIASLERLQQCRDAILAFPSLIQMDDFHKNNIMVCGSEVTGFIDLEMTRYGNEVLVLAAALAAFGGIIDQWHWFRQGYEEKRGSVMGKDLFNLVCVAAPFTQWLRFMWYWTTEAQFLEEGEKTREWPIRDIKAIVQKLS